MQDEMIDKGVVNEDLKEYNTAIEDGDELFDNPTKTFYHYGARKGKRKGKIEVKSTYKLQLASLHMFAATLGYQYDEFNGADGGVFYKINNFNEEGVMLKTSLPYISTKTFIKWYNNEAVTLEDKVKFQEGLTDDKVQLAVEGKLVKKVYMQVCGFGKERYLQVQRHVVSFT